MFLLSSLITVSSEFLISYIQDLSLSLFFQDHSSRSSGFPNKANPSGKTWDSPQQSLKLLEGKPGKFGKYLRGTDTSKEMAFEKSMKEQRKMISDGTGKERE